MKICNNCKISKPDSEFRLRQKSEDNKTQRLYSNCKDCEKKINALTSELKKTAPPHNGKCDCCGEASKLYLDHCHKTGKFRGWLCNNCNVGISRLGDNLAGVGLAVKYLIKNKINKFIKCVKNKWPSSSVAEQ